MENLNSGFSVEKFKKILFYKSAYTRFNVNVTCLFVKFLETEDLRYLHRLHRLDRLGCRYFIFIFVQTKLFIEYLQV